MDQGEVRVPYETLHRVLRDILLGLAMPPARAEVCARLFADASRDGVPSHGLNLFPRFVAMIKSGVVDVRARAERVGGRAALERWNGRSAPGNLNAHDCMNAAIALSKTYGIGCVALANTNHWGRGAAYGWQAADAGFIGICWTNTLANLPPWGADAPRVGNNPLVIAVPRSSGHVVLDMAMSQFSIGKLAIHRRSGEPLPVPGGYDASGELTHDAAAILASGRTLPIGFWKGSGLAILLDLVAVVISGGRATHEISLKPEEETGLSQVFVAIDRSFVATGPETAAVDGIVDSVHARIPGQRTLETRSRSLAEGVVVDRTIWETLIQ